MKWIGQHIYDQISKFRNKVDFSENVTFYQPVNNADPEISIGASDDERLKIGVAYQGTTTQTAQIVNFSTFTESTTANDGRFHFNVDGTRILKIQDNGIDLDTNMGLKINEVDIITDSSGTATLSNIDALDATTISTLNAALTAGDITGVDLTGAAPIEITSETNTTSGNYSATIEVGAATTGDRGVVELATTAETTTGTDTVRAVTPDGLKDGYQGSANVTTLGTIGTGTWQGTAIASEYLDSDTAHLSGGQSFSGVKTFQNGSFFKKGINSTGNRASMLNDGTAIHVDAQDVTDENTSASGTAASFRQVSIEGPRLMATNSSVTTTDASTLYISNSPLASTNQTITNTWSLWVDNGNARFDGSIYSGTTEAINNSGVIQVAAQTVIDHDQLANYAANEHYTQANITTVGTIGTGVWNGDVIASAYIADDAVTFAKALGVTSNIFDNKIKLIPSDFMANDDGGNQKFGVGYVETAGAGYGMRTANNATELYAFVSIPQGMTATHVDIFDKNDLAVEVFEAQINATTMVSKGSGNANTTIDISDVASTATNFLVIEVTTTSATNDKVYGGTVTIA